MKRNRKGASLSEYVILVALIAIMILGILWLLGGRIQDVYNTVRFEIGGEFSAQGIELAGAGADSEDPSAPAAGDPPVFACVTMDFTAGDVGGFFGVGPGQSDYGYFDASSYGGPGPIGSMNELDGDATTSATPFDPYDIDIFYDGASAELTLQTTGPWKDFLKGATLTCTGPEGTQSWEGSDGTVMRADPDTIVADKYATMLAVDAGDYRFSNGNDYTCQIEAIVCDAADGDVAAFEAPNGTYELTVSVEEYYPVEDSDPLLEFASNTSLWLDGARQSYNDLIYYSEVGVYGEYDGSGNPIENPGSFTITAIGGDFSRFDGKTATCVSAGCPIESLSVSMTEEEVYDMIDGKIYHKTDLRFDGIPEGSLSLGDSYTFQIVIP